MTAWKRERSDERDYVGPLLITSRNSEAATGRPWRDNLEVAEEYGCEILQLSPKVRAIVAADLMRALRAKAEKSAAQQAPITEAQEAEQLLRVFGLELRQ